MEEIKEIKKDIKDIKDTLASIDKTLAVNTVSLEVHVKRTSLSEDRISKLEYWALGLVTTSLIAIVLKLLL
jgi:hypothetical protein